MATAVYLLIALFAAISGTTGLLAWWLVGPRRWWIPMLPAVAAFGALYLSAHRFGWSLGPTVPLFGLDVSLPGDAALAAGVAVATALVQRAMVDRRSIRA